MKETSNNKYINNKQFQLLELISRESGLSNFWACGSITYFDIASKLGVHFKIKDYDLAIIGNKRSFINLLKTLKYNDFHVAKKGLYYLKFNKAFQIIAHKKNIILDIAIVDTLNHLGHFNWESIFWHFPSGIIKDEYGSIDYLYQKKLLPVILPNEENPFILLSRLLKLCSRFDLDFSEDRHLNIFLKNLFKEIRGWKCEDYFHGFYAKEHAYFNILKSILNSKDRSIFVERLKRSGVLDLIFPELKCVSDFLKSEEYKSIEEMILFLKNRLDKYSIELEEFNFKVNLFSYRLKNKI